MFEFSIDVSRCGPTCACVFFLNRALDTNTRSGCFFLHSQRHRKPIMKDKRASCRNYINTRSSDVKSCARGHDHGPFWHSLSRARPRARNATCVTGDRGTIAAGVRAADQRSSRQVRSPVYSFWQRSTTITNRTKAASLVFYSQCNRWMAFLSFSGQRACEIS